MDIFDLLKADHRKVETLFSEIEKTDDTEKLYNSFNQLYKALNVHSQAEELTFYPALRECKSTQDMLEEAEEEHVEAEELLEEIKQLSPTSSEFKNKMLELKEAVQHHVREEENEIFDQARQCMEAQELQQLEKEFQQIKSRLEAEIPATSI